ncbi:MAG TPA: hypothetical protein VE954_09255 [Oligoflexus sp.]|uniref:hypothetical protein n=1 Tax=Oligoflexus sp. TaxID=1971216 RepID=UPI002D3D7F6A|nr:hypothetical protein [Oligoflexus sp.]HYX33288.1 hypothetical protein [Oligoflexus sp.]
MKLIMKRSITGLFLTLLALGCDSSSPQFSAVKEIKVPSAKDGTDFIDLVGRFTHETKTVYLLRIGHQLREVEHCDGVNDLWEWIDRQPHPLDEVSTQNYLIDHPELEARPALSCNGLDKSKQGELSAEINEDLYRDQQGYYFSTGKSGEFFKLPISQAGCAFTFVTKLFNFEERLRFAQWGAPETSGFVELTCQDTSSPYQILLYPPAIATEDNTEEEIADDTAESDGYPGFQNLIVLTYKGLNAKGQSEKTYLPIHRWNGLPLQRAKAKEIVEALKSKFPVSEVEQVGGNALFPTLENLPFFDVCLENCAPDRKPKHEILRNTNALEFVAAAPNKVVLTTDGRGERRQVWSPAADIKSIFDDCAGDLYPFFGLATSEDPLFDSLRKQLLKSTPASTQPVFRCPARTEVKTCKAVLDKALYTVAGPNGFNELLKSKANCSKGQNLEVLLDSNVVIQGRESIRLSLFDGKLKSIRFRPLVDKDHRTLTFQYFCDQADACPASLANNELPVFTVAKGLDVTFERLNLKATSNTTKPEWMMGIPKLNAFHVTGDAQLRLSDVALVHPGDSNSLAWNRGVILRPSLGIDGNPAVEAPGRLHCLKCGMKVKDIGIDGLRAQVIIMPSAELKPELATIQAGSNALYLTGRSEALVQQAVLMGPNVVTLGSESKAFVHKAELKLKRENPANPSYAFRFLGNGRSATLGLEIWDSKVSGLPGEQLGPFQFARFESNPKFWMIDLNRMAFSRISPDDLAPEELVSDADVWQFLKCEGAGILNYKAQNRCSVVR